ncbi:dTDP-4-amino-4,6-dideoxygalactose transaminase [Seinonella peptonophila]|uniref:dTDP-4-amino-4,6-dideoxygalactose transaminase n=1 Tax=Seinonella peptonophila TaxID=112248 RepID=A0A1M4XRY7_9BACL|nr:DegT/DnrJ/EryC1/StrS family aminotransferase [Seinonella peptonophila]SHE96344.1 dTDP-4-amino-4,6-dideoxygalactose transaminase [Seinonella peptonophila]
MSSISLLDLKAQFETIREDIQAAAMRVLESGAYIMGSEVKALEEEVAAFCGVKHAIGVGNGTDALLLALKAQGIGAGDEVITTPFTFFATAEVIAELGATPVFVDIDPKTYNIDVKKIEAKITAKTKAIIPVHIFGQPADMDQIMEIAEKHHLFVLEDAAQAMGSTYQDKRIGNLGHAATFSFFPTKNLGGYGDGGMIVTNDDQLADTIRILRVHGSYPKKYYHNMLGYNSRLDALQAAMLRVKLPYLDQWNDARRQRAERYNQLLADTPLVTPFAAEQRKHIYHLYIVQAEERDELMAYLKEQGVSTGIYYPLPLHLQEVFKHLEYAEGSMPHAERAALRTFAIPLYPELSFDVMEQVANAIKTFYKGRI